MAVTGFTLGEVTNAEAPLATTSDALFGGSVAIVQPARGAGYRINADAILLAAFAAGVGGFAPQIARPPARVAFDLGAGVGAVAMSLLHMGACERAVLVEADASLCRMAQRNLEKNGWADRAEVLASCVRDAARDRRGEAQLVVCNPPYVAPGRGRLPALAAKARARSGDLTLFVEAAREVCGRRGRVCFIYPSQELSTLTATLRRSGLEPKRMRAVHATKRSAARAVMVEAQPAKSGGLLVMAPFIEREGDAESFELATLLERAG